MVVTSRKRGLFKRIILYASQIAIDLVYIMSAEPGRKTAYSADLRWRIVWQRIGMEQSYRKIASSLNIAPSTAVATLKLFQRTGDVSSRRQPSRKDLRCLNDSDELYVIGLVLENPGMYLQEICQEIYNVTCKQVSASTVCRLLARHGFTRKKIQKVAKQRSVALRALFMARMRSYDRNLLVWVDETGSDHRDYTRQYGYAIQGQKPIYHRLLKRASYICYCCHEYGWHCCC